MPEKTQEQLDAEFEAAVEADDNEAAQAVLDSIEDGVPPAVSAEAIGLEPTVAKEATPMQPNTVAISKDMLGIGGFTPVLAEMADPQIDELLIKVSGTDDVMALIFPGTSVIDADHRIHLEQRGDLKRAARGLALAAAGGVDMDSQVILSNSGRSYTIVDGVCLELKQTEQPDFQGNVALITQQEPCKGHLAYDKNPTTNQFELNGRQHMRCLHQWALMFALGYFVTASEKVFRTIAKVEISQRVGDEAARTWAGAQIGEWTQNSAEKREIRTEFARSINARKQELGLSDNSYLPPKTEIGGYALPDGKTVSQAVADLRGRQFALTVQLPMNDKVIEITTRTVKNLTELASVVAPHFAFARNNDGELVALELVAR